MGICFTGHPPIYQQLHPMSLSPSVRDNTDIKQERGKQSLTKVCYSW